MIDMLPCCRKYKENQFPFSTTVFFDDEAIIFYGRENFTISHFEPLRHYFLAPQEIVSFVPPATHYKKRSKRPFCAVNPETLLGLTYI